MTKSYEFAGGPVRRSQCVYVPRDADRLVHSQLLGNNLVVLTAPRQTGKTSLAQGVITQLRTEGHAICFIDFRHKPGWVTDPDSWFTALFRGIAEGLGIAQPTFAEWLLSSASSSFTERTVDLFATLVTSTITGRVTIAFDELDMLKMFSYHTDQFFEALRLVHARREDLQVAFLLIGISHPIDLLKIVGRSSFNVGYQVVLPDFADDDETVRAWTEGFEGSPEVRFAVGQEVLHQTGGQPYLTSRLLHELNRQQATTAGEVIAFAREFVDDIRKKKLTESHFLAPEEIIRENERVAYRVLDAYRKILQGPLAVDEVESQVLTVLRIAGLIREREGRMDVKCPIYRNFFDERWCKVVEAEVGSPEFFPAPRPVIRPAGERKKICVINTGGTMGMERLPNGKMGQPPDLRKFFHNYADIFMVAEIDPVPLCCKDGANMFPEDWETLAQAIFRRRNDGYSGFVIAHGTDTLAYTASAVAFALGPALNFPVVFTGSQAPHHIFYGDAKTNLLRACEVATLPIPEVVVAFGDSVFRAVRVEKKDDYRFEGFHSPTYRPLAIIAERIEVQKDLLRERATTGWMTELKAPFSRGIVQIAQTPGLEPSLFLGLLDRPDLKGIIVQSLGIGNLPTEGLYSFKPLIDAAVAHDIPVLIMNPYPVLPEFVANYAPASAPLQWGAISGGMMTPAAAATKFMWVLPQVEGAVQEGNVKPRHKLREIERMMSTSFVGEVDRSTGALGDDS